MEVGKGKPGAKGRDTEEKGHEIEYGAMSESHIGLGAIIIFSSTGRLQLFSLPDASAIAPIGAFHSTALARP